MNNNGIVMYDGIEYSVEKWGDSAGYYVSATDGRGDEIILEGLYGTLSYYKNQDINDAYMIEDMVWSFCLENLPLDLEYLYNALSEILENE